MQITHETETPIPPAAAVGDSASADTGCESQTEGDLLVEADPLVEDDLLVEDVSIDGMCGVY